MSLVETYGPHLPYLRRYARALTGSQASGDSYIHASLSALSADPNVIDADMPPRVALYQYFHVIWGGTGAKLTQTDDQDKVPQERLSKLAPIQRQAFLLSAVENFSIPEISLILGKDETEVSNLMDLAQQDIENDLKTKVLIVEDEPIIAADIESLVEQMGHEVTNIATTRTEAVAMAKDNPPGLILCDIQLADDSSGIDAIKDILGEMDVPVIFVTAFPERFLTGERPEPAYLLSKPFQERTLIATIGQALFFHPRAN